MAFLAFPLAPDKPSHWLESNFLFGSVVRDKFAKLNSSLAPMGAGANRCDSSSCHRWVDAGARVWTVRGGFGPAVSAACVMDSGLWFAG